MRRNGFLIIYLLVVIFNEYNCVQNCRKVRKKKQATGSSVRGYKQKFTIEQLRSTVFPRLISNDVYLDPCKSEDFLGDVAMPVIQYESELELMKTNNETKKETDEIEKYKKEILCEGLQIEAEGLTNIQKTKFGRDVLKIATGDSKPTTGENSRVQPPKVIVDIGEMKENTDKESKEMNVASNVDNAATIREHTIDEYVNYTNSQNEFYIQQKKNVSEKIKNTTSNTRTDFPKSNKHRNGSVLVMTEELSSENSNFVAASRHRRAATAKKERIWDYGVIPYEIDSHFSGAHKALFKQAMRHWENFTCIKFVERNPTDHPNFIVFTERPCGCCSFVGKRGDGGQAISIGKSCDKFGIVVHELGHVIGFWHEHTRPDRDNHVQIVRDHIMPGQEYNFNKLTEEEVNSLGLPYDYESIMHYARNTFSKGTYLDTIYPIENSRNLKRRPEIGQRIRLSEGDIAQTKLLYKCPKCGRTFQESTGNFSNYLSHVNGTTRCEWRVTATHGERIVLNITDLDIYKSEQCSTDYLEVRDGYWHKSKLISRFCGNGRIDELITSIGSRMLVTHVISEKSGSAFRGFSANYETICGGDVYVDEENGHLESPNYPDDYQSSKECIWRLTVPENYQVALKFQSFEIENHDNCAYDYVEIRNGHTADSPLIGVYCGYKLPPDIHSTTNRLSVKFVSDSTVQKAGFSAMYMKEFDECALANHGCEQMCINTLGGFECACKIGYQLHSDNKHCEDTCGGRIESSNGTIVSPSFPEVYPGNKTCIWEIIAPVQYKITLNFTHFDLEGNNAGCEYDRVEVHSRSSIDSVRRHGVFCGGRLPSVITSETNILRIEFKSDNSIHKSGFAATFFADVDECAINNGGCQHECHNTVGSYECSCHNGFTLHDNKHDCKEGGCKHEISAPKGNITSPNYPDFYPSKKDCIWHFITTPGHRIKLAFEVFELEPHQDCSYDHVVLYDGDSTDSYMIGRYCGSKPPHPVISLANQLYMVFKSDQSVQRKGFFANHVTVCGGRLLATNRVKHFYSHARYGDLNYEGNLNCEWTIETEYGFNVRLNFLTFEIEDDRDCQYDFVDVFSGTDDSGPSFGKFCGNTIPADIISTNEALLVRFRTDVTMTSKGFSASYVLVETANSETSSHLSE